MIVYAFEVVSYFSLNFYFGVSVRLVMVSLMRCRKWNKCYPLTLQHLFRLRKICYVQ